MTRKGEYGGYLPLELPEGEDWFSGYGENNILRTNSAKAALYFAVRSSHISKLYLPHYLCRSVKEMLKSTGIRMESYYLNSGLLPKLPDVEPDAGVLLVNYFGIMEEQVKKEGEKYRTVFLDHSHGFFAEPVLRDGVFNIYSCRKFVGVPDGGYLVSRNCAGELEADEVSGHFSYLVTSLEQGCNAAYQEKMECDRYFLGNYKGMSKITRGILSSVDYEKMRKQREENFQRIHKRLKEYNELDIEDKAFPAYLYPFLPKDAVKNGKRLKAALVAEKIYVPTLWRELISPAYAGRREYHLSENTVFLPVDQRYGEEDMDYLAQRVKDLLEGWK